MDLKEAWQRAEAQERAGNAELANALYAGFRDKPGYAPWAMLKLTGLALAAGRLRDATRHALEASARLHGDPRLLLASCRQLMELGEDRAALAVARGVAGLPEPNLMLFAEMAKLLSDFMHPEMSLRLLQRLGARGSGLGAGVDYLTGLNLIYSGDLGQGEAALRRSLSIDDTFAPAYWSLAKLRSAEGRSTRIDRLQARLHEIGDGHADAPLLLYSLFHELDAEDDVEAAWLSLQRAMQARRAQVAYDEALQEQLCDTLASRMHALAERTRGVGDPVATPIFVVGMPRTGTTVIEQWLCKRYSMNSTGEPRDLVRQMRWVSDVPGSANPDLALVGAMEGQDLALLGERYLAHTTWRAGGAPHYSDKWPENYLVLGYALAALPQARAIAVRRDPMDSCWSNMKEWFGASYFYSYDAAETARQYGRYHRLANAAREAFGARVLQVEYERFVQDPGHEGGRIARELGLEPRRANEGANGVVATASAVQVRGEVSTRNIGGWTRYSRWLGPLEAALENALEREAG